MNVAIKESNLVPVIRQLHSIPARVLQAAGRGLAAGLLHVVGVSQNEFLAGPRPARLGEVTGRLRRSIQSEVTVYPGRGAIGRIGTNVPYGAPHEFGEHGVQQVRAHSRMIKVAFGKPLLKPKAVQVKAHTRQINYAGRPFIRPALTQSLGVIKSRIDAEIAAVK